MARVRQQAHRLSLKSGLFQVDDGYLLKGGLVEWVRETLDLVLEIVAREPDQQGFEVLPRRRLMLL